MDISFDLAVVSRLDRDLGRVGTLNDIRAAAILTHGNFRAYGSAFVGQAQVKQAAQTLWLADRTRGSDRAAL